MLALAPFLLAAAAFIAAAATYARLPPTLASHWSATGAVNGYMSRTWGVLLIPLIMLALAVLAVIIPKIDPRGASIAAFQKQYDMLWATICALLAYVYALTIAWNLGHRFNFVYLLAPALAALFWIIGASLRHVTPNWFVGIRTPWTLSNETVWRTTNDFASRMFRVAAILMLVPLLLGDARLFVPVIIAVIALVGVATVAYSYIQFRKIKK